MIGLIPKRYTKKEYEEKQMEEGQMPGRYKMKEMMEMKVPKENNNIKKVKPKLLTKKGTKKNGKK